MRRLLVIVAVSSCAGDPVLVPGPPTHEDPKPAPEAYVTRPVVQRRISEPPPPPLPLEVEFIGVGGFMLRRGDDAVMTPPLYTRPTIAAAQLGTPVSSDVRAIAARFPANRVAGLKAVLVGHAHYDHLMDAPAVQLNADHPMLYGNTSMKNLLAAISPVRPAGCPAAGPREVTLEPERVVALDAPGASKVDYRSCPAKRPTGAPLEGIWVKVPNSNVRFMAICSEHPDQFGPVHFAPGDVTQEQCELPTRADGWKEGETLAFLIDFLDPTTQAPTMRVYYQDAPGNQGIAYPPPELLAEKRVDLAMLCVGTYNVVPNEPTNQLNAMTPRYALGGHWEDFFKDADLPPTGLPFTDVKEWETRAQASMSSAEAKPLVRNGVDTSTRALLPNPGDRFVVAPEH